MNKYNFPKLKLKRFKMYLVAISMILILLILLKLTTKTSLQLGKVNLLSIIIYRDFGVLTAIALAFWIASPMTNQHYVMSQIPVQSLKVALYASFTFMLFVIFYGYFFKILFSELSSKMPRVNENYFLSIIKLWLLFLSLIMILMYFQNPPVLTKLFQGATALDISIARSEVGGNNFFKIVRNTWVPAASYTMLYFYSRNKNLIYWLLFSILLAIICSVWSGAKSMLASLMLGYLGVYIISKNNIKISNAKILFYASIFIAFIIFMYYITTLNTGSTFDIILTTAKYRFFGQAGGVGYAFYIYPTFMEHKYFTGISSFLSSLSATQFSSVYADLIDYAVPEFADISGAMSSFAAGDAYGLFGWWGIIIGPLFVAFFYYLFHYMSIKGNARVLFIGMYGLYFGNAYLASSFYSFVWPVGMVLSISPMLVFYFLSSIKHQGQVYEKNPFSTTK